MGAGTFIVTVFGDVKAEHKAERAVTLPGLRDLIASASAPTKGGLPLLKLARFGDRRSANDCLRNNGNVTAISGCELDYDGERVSIDDAVALLEEHRLFAVVHTSPSHADGKPRWRVLLPTSAELPPEQRAALVSRANGALGGIAAPESWVLSQAFFFGAVNGTAMRTAIVDGDFIDLRDDLDARAIGPPGEAVGAVPDGAAHTSGDPQAPIADIVAALAVISNDDRPWDGEDGWNYIGMAVWGASGGSTEGLAAFRQWSGKSIKFNERETALRWSHYWRSPPTRLGFGTLVMLARATDPTWSPPSHQRPTGDVCGDVSAPANSDEALALAYAARHAGTLRYVAAWSRWLRFESGRWVFEDTLAAFDLARVICREAARGANKLKDAKQLADARTVAAIERLARSDRRLAATVSQWDDDAWVLNTPAGTVNLRDGKTRDHRPQDYITKSTAVAPGGDCPRWHAFLDYVTAGDRELQRFMQRVAGYCLTGDISEHALLFGHGTGANGKGVFVGALVGVLGDYAMTAPMEAFLASKVDRHPTELAGLRGARLVTASETEEGRRWAESKIKALTGGDKIAARFMRQDFFEFVPQFKLLITGNHKPGLRGVDEAIRRRMHLIPFSVTIPEAERDEKLPEKLRAEWPGILRWAIDGCILWQRDGLAAPAAVRRATDDYLAAEDAIAIWIEECCTVGPQNTALGSTLFKNWSAWATAAGEFVGSQKRLFQALEDRGFVKQRVSQGTIFQGVWAAE